MFAGPTLETHPFVVKLIANTKKATPAGKNDIEKNKHPNGTAHESDHSRDFISLRVRKTHKVFFFV